jgi:hypothetical protein
MNSNFKINKIFHLNSGKKLNLQNKKLNLILNNTILF